MKVLGMIIICLIWLSVYRLIEFLTENQPARYLRHTNNFRGRIFRIIMMFNADKVQGVELEALKDLYATNFLPLIADIQLTISDWVDLNDLDVVVYDKEYFFKGQSQKNLILEWCKSAEKDFDLEEFQESEDLLEEINYQLKFLSKQLGSLSRYLIKIAKFAKENE